MPSASIRPAGTVKSKKHKNVAWILRADDAFNPLAGLVCSLFYRSL
jgi:hypothetical protein